MLVGKLRRLQIQRVNALVIVHSVHHVPHSVVAVKLVGLNVPSYIQIEYMVTLQFFLAQKAGRRGYRVHIRIRFFQLHDVVGRNSARKSVVRSVLGVLAVIRCRVVNIVVGFLAIVLYKVRGIPIRFDGIVFLPDIVVVQPKKNVPAFLVQRLEIVIRQIVRAALYDFRKLVVQMNFVVVIEHFFRRAVQHFVLKSVILGFNALYNFVFIINMRFRCEIRTANLPNKIIEIRS